jgi:hypothetical protein
MKPGGRAEIESGAAWLRWAVAALLAAYVLLSLYVLWRAAVIAPFSDEFDWIARYRQLQADHRWLAYLLAPHNLNRLVWTRLLLAMDMSAFGGTNAPLIVSGAIALAVMAGVLGLQAARAAPAPLRLPAGALAAMLTLTAVNVLDASLPINVTYTHAAAFAVLAIGLSEGARGSPLGWRGAGALACAVASAFGSGAGLALWPVMAWGALRRRDWKWLAAVLIAGGLFIGLYGAGGGGGARTDALSALHDPLGAGRLALGYLLLPWTRLVLPFAWIGGLAVAGVGMAALALRGGAGASRAERIACGLVLFSLGTALMAGLGRAGLEDPANVPLRYAVFVAPLQVGLLMLALPYAGELWRARRGAAQAVVAAILLLVTLQDTVMAAKVVRASDLIRNTVADFRAGRRTPEMRTFVYPDLTRAEQDYARLRHDGLFQRELHLKPAPPPR